MAPIDESEASLDLPALDKELDAVRDRPIGKLTFSFEPGQLPRGKVLALSLTAERLFSQPMRFLFAHYRRDQRDQREYNVRTWMPWMNLVEPEPAEVRPDGKRVVGRFEWFNQTSALSEELDGTDLRDLPATFALDLDRPQGRPEGGVSEPPSGGGGPRPSTTRALPRLATLASSGAAFALTVVGEDPAAQQAIPPEETALDLRVTAIYQPGVEVTLFRSNHGPLERDLLRGLSGKPSAIEREAILSQDPRPRALAAALRRQRRSEADVLMERDEATLAPDERRVVATLRQSEAQQLMSRVFGSAAPPGPERKALQASAVAACETVVRLLAPLVAVDARYHDVGRTYWAASSLAHYYEVTREAATARRYAQLAVDLVEQALAQLPDEPELAGWLRSGRERLTGVRPGSTAASAARKRG